MELERLSRRGYMGAVAWTLAVATIIVVATAGLGRAALNIQGALTEKPDLAVYLLLPEEEISDSTLLREQEGERHYLVETKDGPKLVILKKGEREWFVSTIEPLRE